MIVNIKHGFIFLGSRYRVINNKTIVSISSNKKRRIRRNIKKKNIYIIRVILVIRVIILVLIVIIKLTKNNSH